MRRKEEDGGGRRSETKTEPSPGGEEKHIGVTKLMKTLNKHKK